MHARMLKTATGVPSQTRAPETALTKRGVLTQLYRVVTKEEPGQDHLPESETGAEGREEAHGHDAQKVDENNSQGGIHEAEAEDGLRQSSDGEAGDDHVRR